MQSVDVRTAQNVRIRYEAASIGDRIVAYILDTIILVAVIFGISTILSSLETSLPVSISVVLFIPVMSYHLLCEVFLNGQSIGKRVLNIKVVKLDGSRPSLGAYLIRWLFRILEITLFTGVLALIVILINGKGQRLGDVAAGTTVVKLRPPTRVSRHSLIRDEPEAYNATYATVTQLSDSDISIVMEALASYRKTANKEPVIEAEKRVKEYLDIQSNQPTLQFLYTIIKDYNHLTSQM